MLDELPDDDRDHWKEILVTFDAWHDHVPVTDIVAQMNHTYHWGDHTGVSDCMKPTVHKNIHDRISIDEGLYFKYIDEHEPIT